MLLPGYSWFNPGKDYRFGFNGAETDDEVKGQELSIAFEYRVYDPRLGRFNSIDPLTDEFPYYSPYLFAGNQAISAYEVQGLAASSDKNDDNDGGGGGGGGPGGPGGGSAGGSTPKPAKKIKPTAAPAKQPDNQQKPVDKQLPKEPASGNFKPNEIQFDKPKEKDPPPPPYAKARSDAEKQSALSAGMNKQQMQITSDVFEVYSSTFPGGRIRMLTKARELSEKQRPISQGDVKARRNEENDASDVARKTDAAEKVRKSSEGRVEGSGPN